MALPVATPAQYRQYLRRLAREHRTALTLIVAGYGAATAAGLVIPRVVGDLVARAGEHSLTTATIDRTIALVAGCLLVQVALTRYAQLRALVLGERVLAELREGFVSSALQLPIGVVEEAGTGDLSTRTSRDIDALARSVRFAIPETVVAAITVLFTAGATVLLGAWTLLPLVAGVPLLWAVTRWYLRRARPGYLRASASYSATTNALDETVAGARTVELFGLAGHRDVTLARAIAESRAAERHTMRLRMVFFGGIEFGYAVPLVSAVLIGGWLHHDGYASLADVTAALLYLQRLVDPLDRLLNWLDELQNGGASLARLLGVGHVPPEPRDQREHPAGGELDLRGVRFAYRAGHDILHGIDLDIRSGERLAVVGPSGAGKSTLARILAGHTLPTGGRVSIGGVDLARLDLTILRHHVCLVTQEQHVFQGTLRTNLALPRPAASDTELRDALRLVHADWYDGLPDGLDTVLGAAHTRLDDAQAQQVALARIVIADPRVLILDEATSMIDPRPARRLEQALAAVLTGRTVIAIAHRLQTAQDADRVALMSRGRIVEHGSHRQLLAADGEYAGLWRQQRAPA